MSLAYVYARDEATRMAMLPRDEHGDPMDPIPDLDASLEAHVVGVGDPNREAMIAAAL